MINVVIADDQTLVRRGLRSLLELTEGIAVVTEAADGEEALAALESHPVDVLMLDLQMPKLDGIQVLQTMNEKRDSTPVLVLTTFDDDERLLACARLGAKGYLLKDVTLERLVEAVETVANGETLIQPMVTERVLQGLTSNNYRKSAASLPEALTAREMEVLRYLAGGYSNRQIAQGMSLSEGTVKNHVSAILAKLGVRARTRAVLKAIDMGLL